MSRTLHTANELRPARRAASAVRTRPETVCLRAYPKPDAKAAWERALRGLLDACPSAHGYRGSIVLKPVSASRDGYQVMIRFESGDALRRWRQSTRTREAFAAMATLEVHPRAEACGSGHETWIETDAVAERHPSAVPPKYKMAIVVWLAVFGAVLPLIAWIRMWTEAWPAVLRSAFSAALGVGFMTWIALPLLTHLFRDWLYPDLPSNTSEREST